MDYRVLIAVVLVPGVVRADTWTGAVRAGVATLDYEEGRDETDCADIPMFSGAGWFGDAELGWRHGDWTFSGFLSVLYRHDVMAGQWDLKFHAYELGARVTWHRGPFSLGIGVMPIMWGDQHGTYTEESDTYPDTGQNHLVGAELHAAYEVARFDRVGVELFGLAETSRGTDTVVNYDLTSYRLGVGVAF